MSIQILFIITQLIFSSSLQCGARVLNPCEAGESVFRMMILGESFLAICSHSEG